MKKQILCMGLATIIGIGVPVDSQVYAETISRLQREVDNSEHNVWESYDKYVVDVLNQLGRDTTEDEWRENLIYLQSDYELLKQKKDVNILLIDYYISEYSSQIEYEKQANTNIEMHGTGDKIDEYGIALTSTTHKNPEVTSSFNRRNAINYALEYYDTFNSNYPNWTEYGGRLCEFCLTMFNSRW